jgi:hypothetical protein
MPQYRTNSTLSDFNDLSYVGISMLAINSGHHYLPTYQILMISDNVEFLRYCGGHFVFEMSAIFKMAAKTRYKKWAVKIQHCPISSKFDMWVDNDVSN